MHCSGPPDMSTSTSCCPEPAGSELSVDAWTVPASSERPTHHSPILPPQSRDGPTAKPRGSSPERSEAGADGTGGSRPAIDLNAETHRAGRRRTKHEDLEIKQPENIQRATKKRFHNYLWNRMAPCHVITHTTREG
ncbi:hypothetical protein EYF80_040327 [Liparis tanakae]|uniref:Uncharacterized protein n=1 Tax=Liparis tanakae TaxID=230148 RepID=A0A4Z2G7E7_9TELE|nr:hypothetical protein EYF80_040327 [Liparis tanakae]